ncbi:DUF6602 domain-containing protein [Lentzea sp. NPDC004789]
MPEARTNYVETYWSGVVQRLQAEVDVLNRLVPHRGEQGRANELTLARLVESLLPADVGVGTGIVIDSTNKASKQIDIIIYDRASQPQILGQTTQLLFPVETVFMAIEVKTTLSEEELQTCSASKKALDSLKSTTEGSKPGYFLMGYAASLLPQALMDKVSKIPEEMRPDLLCVLNPGLIAGKGLTAGDPGAGTGAYTAGLTPLHKLDGDGARRAMEWSELEEHEKGSKKVVRNGFTYPVTALSQSDRSRYICEPGRALLLFCEQLLAFLSERSSVSKPFLQNYLTGTARDLRLLTIKQP